MTGCLSASVRSRRSKWAPTDLHVLEQPVVHQLLRGRTPRRAWPAGCRRRCCRDRRRRSPARRVRRPAPRRRARRSRAPCRPRQVRLPAERLRSGTDSPVRPRPRLHFVGDEQRARARQTSVIASANARGSGRTPPSPRIGSAMIAAVALVDRGDERVGRVGIDERHRPEERLERRRGSARRASPTARPSCGRRTRPRWRRSRCGPSTPCVCQ